MTGILFANYDFSKSPKTPPKRKIPGGFDDSPSPGLGYLVFPFPGASAPTTTPSKAPPPPIAPTPTQPEPEPETPSTPAPTRTAEHTQATLGEESWVRSGGILRRPSSGKRDYARTEALRAELKLRDEEKRLVDRWEEYERRWKGLEGSKGELGYDDIPWPTSGALDVGSIEEFVLGSLRVRGEKTTRKERLRRMILRWHPDKLVGVLGRVKEEDKERVREDVGQVVRCLHELQRS